MELIGGRPNDVDKRPACEVVSELAKWVSSFCLTRHAEHVLCEVLYFPCLVSGVMLSTSLVQHVLGAAIVPQLAVSVNHTSAFASNRIKLASKEPHSLFASGREKHQAALF